MKNTFSVDVSSRVNMLHDILAALLLILCIWAHLFLYVLLICSKDNVTTRSSGSIQLRWIAVFLGFSVAPLGAF